ncbi:serine hydrolase domain-containing protein [Sediminicola luteus]|uniref:Amide hydrolase n=1 Tax=Sediminicola luteus TaxID=319238 RepID=A0A2A4GEA5_9FLAO|nr:serine hydrolase [Sediminicola luteus]PCE66320.1 amide hydrolase [Sediminicola luteus]
MVIARTLFFVIFLWISSWTVAQTPIPFAHAAPESKGFSSEKLALLEQHLEASGASSMMVLVDGAVIFEWGDTSRKHLIHSIRKALINALYGIAIEKGQIDTSMTLKALGIDDIAPKLNPEEQEARIADLLKSRSGVYHNAAAENQAMLRSRPPRGSHKPGTHYYYNNWDFNTLGALLEKQTGQSIYKLFKKQIAQPLGMREYKGRYLTMDVDSIIPDFGNLDGFYQYEKERSQYPAYHFRLSTRDLARFGQLYLNHGNWEGQQILPKKWIDKSTKPYSVYNPKYGNAYGMLWRVRVPNKQTKRNSFFHTGLGIHMLGVYPDSKLVMVHRVPTEGDFDYKEMDFYKMLGLLFGARIQE